MYIGRMEGHGVLLKPVAKRIVGLWDTTMREGEKATLHTHESYEELYYIVEGEAKVRIGDEELTVSRGDIVYIPPGVTHNVEAISSLRIISFKVYTGGYNSDLNRLYIS
ncbi:cupin domain-containing protein [Candidatus Bathyarchaeota archaeon]|nr:cupin domain-containing protein [Candidatus Bathyarchaeota archaeon]